MFVTFVIVNHLGWSPSSSAPTDAEIRPAGHPCRPQRALPVRIEPAPGNSPRRVLVWSRRCHPRGSPRHSPARARGVGDRGGANAPDEPHPGCSTKGVHTSRPIASPGAARPLACSDPWQGRVEAAAPLPRTAGPPLADPALRPRLGRRRSQRDGAPRRRASRARRLRNLRLSPLAQDNIVRVAGRPLYISRRPSALGPSGMRALAAASPRHAHTRAALPLSRCSETETHGRDKSPPRVTFLRYHPRECSPLGRAWS